MNLFNFNKTKKAFARVDAVLNEPVEERFDEWQNPVLGRITMGGFNSYSSSKALKLSTVYRCVSLVSDSIASLPLVPYTYKDDKGTLSDWRYYDSLSNLDELLNIEPNPYQSAFIFKKLMVTHILLKGNAYIFIDRNKQGVVTQLTLLEPDSVTIFIGKDGTVIYKDALSKREYDRSQIIHLINQTENGITGISTLQYAASTLGIAHDSENHASSFFKSGGNLAGILRPIAGTNINSTKAKDAKNSFISALSTDLNTGTSGSIVVLDSGLEYQPISISPADSQLLESRKYNVNDICRFFNVPPAMAFGESQKYTTTEEQQLDFLVNTMTPMIEKIENEFFRKLYLRQDWATSELRFDTENLMRLNATTRAEYYTKMHNLGAMTTNDIRKKIDGATPTKGGGRAFVQVNLQPLDNLISEQENNEGTLNTLNQIDNKLKSKKVTDEK